MAETKLLKIDPDSPDLNSIQFAATLLRDGGLVAFPTETVYGIGANYFDKNAVEKLYEIKNRPRNKPFTIHISSVDTIRDMQCEISPMAEHLIKTFWPGPLTLILNTKKGKLGFRMPKNSIAKVLISESGVSVVAPSANISGEKPPTEASMVLEKLGGKIDLILDGGKTEFGKESTIVDTTISSYKILRKGAITEDEIAGVLNELV